jgi:hypothetical protein
MKQRMDQRAPRDAGAGWTTSPAGLAITIRSGPRGPHRAAVPRARALWARQRNFDLNEVAGLQSQGGARPANR